MMLPNRRLRLGPSYAVIPLFLVALSPPAAGQSTAANAEVEDIVILRSLRLSRIAPTGFCAPARTGFSAATIEDRYDFKAVATDAASGKITNATDVRVGAVHACFSPTSDSEVVSFYAEGEVGGMPLVGHGQCRTTRRDFPETGISLLTCHLDLTGLPSAYVGGQLTTNSVNSRAIVGPDTDPPGYTQVSIATIRLWKKRSAQ